MNVLIAGLHCLLVGIGRRVDTCWRFKTVRIKIFLADIDLVFKKAV